LPDSRASPGEVYLSHYVVRVSHRVRLPESLRRGSKRQMLHPDMIIDEKNQQMLVVLQFAYVLTDLGVHFVQLLLQEAVITS
jgi:hypothetical protein